MKKIITAAAIFIMLILLLSCHVCAQEYSSPSMSSLSISSYPSKTVYGAFEQFDTTGLALRAVFADGSERIISEKEIRVSYNRDRCFRVGDDSVMLSYGGKSVYLPVTVNRIPYDLSSLDLNSFSVAYNGAHQGYNKITPQIVGLDGLPLKVDASGGGVNVGVYDIKLDFHTDSKDYFVPESRVVSMTVEPASAKIVWDELSFVYDGKSKCPVGYYVDVNGAKVYPTVSGAAINAGTEYIARVTPSDSNYSFSNTSVSYEIRKADYDFSKVVWSKDVFTYDGSTKSISALGLPAGVSIIGYSGDRGVNAGIYNVTAMLKWDESNYNTPPTLTHSWEIKKADYDMSGISFRSESCVYDGMMHYPTAVGRMPVGADGIALEYSFSAGACHVSDGTVAVTINFHTKSGNYNVPAEIHSSVSITPAGISVVWGDLNLSYIGEEQTPTAYSSDCALTVSGGAVNVGRYIATAKTDNTDFYIINDKAEYSIVKADNYWSVMPENSTCYEGREISLTGQSKFGRVEYTFYADAECTQEISTPTDCGKYYAILSVNGSENYGGLKSSVISFEIVEILAVSFVAGIIREDIKAFDRLSAADIVCSVINNDGSATLIDSSLVKIIYENGDSFRKTDDSVKLQYGDFVVTLLVKVGYADYDLSEMKWENISQVYDGNVKSPTLIGLPQGVSVKEYVGGGKIGAGIYTVYAEFIYDSENYNEPSVPPCDFVIEKCKVKIPLIRAVYNGEWQAAVSDSPLYTVVTDSKWIDAAIYSVRIRLNDPANYIFDGGLGTEANAIFEILPATLSVGVNDVRLRLFEKLSVVGYNITRGVIYGDDILTVVPYAEGRSVLLRSENPNYVLDVTPGRIIRLPYPTFKGAMIMLAIAMMVVLLSVTAVRIYQNRDRVISSVAIMRCRWHNRGYKAPMPRDTAAPTPSVEESNDDAPDVQAVVIEHDDENIFIPEERERLEAEYFVDEEAPSIVDFEIDAEKADTLISDSLAKSLITREGEMIYTDGNEKTIINLGDISPCFNAGDRVDVNSLKEKGLISFEVAYFKVLGGGKIDKALTIYANDFSLSAVKMIALTGGQAIKIVTFKGKVKDEKEKNT